MCGGISLNPGFLFFRLFFLLVNQGGGRDGSQVIYAENLEFDQSSTDGTVRRNQGAHSPRATQRFFCAEAWQDSRGGKAWVI